MQAVQQVIFTEEETLKKEPEKPVQPEKPAEEKKQQEEEIKKPKPPKKPNFLSGLFGDWTKTIKDSAKDFVNNATKEEDEYTNDDEDNN